MIDESWLRRHPLLGRAPRAVATALAPVAVERSYGTDEVIFLAGSQPRGLYLVVDGAVRVVRGRGDRQHVVHLERAGGTLGEVPLFAGGAYPATAIASEPTQCVLLSRDALRAAVVASPEFAFLLLEALSGRVRTLVERLDRATSQTIPARLAAYVLERRRSARSDVISLGLTQARLGEELGTVRELVVRALGSLCERRLIERAGSGRYRLLDLDGLRALADR